MSAVASTSVVAAPAVPLLIIETSCLLLFIIQPVDSNSTSSQGNIYHGGIGCGCRLKVWCRN
jgi:hypothetical protein